MIFLSMLALGAVIGFVGAGGAGVTITLLVVGFGVPVHTSLAVALAAMTFTTLSGAVSHFRQHEVVVATGAALGLGGALGALGGAAVSNLLPAKELGTATAVMMLASGGLQYMKLYHPQWLSAHFPVRETLLAGAPLWRRGIPVGMCCGFLAGAFGIGAAAFIQVALMVLFGVPLLQSIGTCMMIILPISAAGGLGYLASGHLDLMIFLQTLAGLTIGAWFGAKGTHLAPLPVLKASIVGMSAIGGIIMLLGR